MPEFSAADFLKTVHDQYEEQLKKMGHANVLIAGRSGVGKSTLINAVFGENLAETGHGKPVTQTTKRIVKQGIPVALYDTRGLEMEKYHATVDQLRTFLTECRNSTDLEDHIHVAWVCVAEDSRRFEDGEQAIVSLFNEFGVPVIVVVTKARQDNGFLAKIKELAPSASQHLSVRAIHEKLDDGHQLPPKGLDILIQATHELIPEGRKSAFAAAQKIDIGLKKNKAHMIIAGSVTAATAAGASPIPFSTSAILIPIQAGMITGITLALGVALETGALSSVVTSAVGCTATTLGGRAIVTGLLKLIPGGGTVVGGVIEAATAAALTLALGKLYLEILTGFMEKYGRNPTGDEIVEALQLAWRNRN
jgi:uncharacterized protein (DUF697 family)/GTP-binding protein EngB required for normal cell division